MEPPRDLCKTFTEKEIKQGINDEKAPGIDAYTSSFFKKARRFLVNDVVQTASEFSANGKLLKVINSTTITLVPKKQPSRVDDCRPIACCNVSCN